MLKAISTALIIINVHALTVPISRIDSIKPISRLQTLMTQHRLEMFKTNPPAESSNKQIHLENIGNTAYLGPVYFTD